MWTTVKSRDIALIHYFVDGDYYVSIIEYKHTDEFEVFICDLVHDVELLLNRAWFTTRAEAEEAVLSAFYGIKYGW